MYHLVAQIVINGREARLEEIDGASKYCVCGNEGNLVRFNLDASDFSNKGVLTAIFTFGGKTVRVPFQSDDNTCEIPIIENSEVVWIGLEGQTDEGGLLRTSTPAKLEYKLSANDLSSEESLPPTKNEYERIIEMINAGMLRGEDGVSVTHEWNGTVLTVTSASGTSSADLKGEKGEKGDAGKIKFIVVNALPSEEIDTEAMYLVPAENAESENMYEEYIYVKEGWEKLGEKAVEVDLSGFVRFDRIQSLTKAQSAVARENINAAHYIPSIDINLPDNGTVIDDIEYNTINQTFSGYQAVLQMINDLDGGRQIQCVLHRNDGYRRNLYSTEYKFIQDENDIFIKFTELVDDLVDEEQITVFLHIDTENESYIAEYSMYYSSPVNSITEEDYDIDSITMPSTMAVKKKLREYATQAKKEDARLKDLALDKATIATFNITAENTKITLKALTGIISIDWGDGTIDGNLTHTYAKMGEYTCIIYGVTSIGEYAFFNCSSLTSIEIPDGVTSIGKWAFEDCSSLTSIEIPDGVTSIGGSAFSRCSSLTSIEIPDGVTSIGSYTFFNCSSLTSVVIPDGVTSIAEAAFYGCSSLTSVVIPDSMTSIGKQAFVWCSSLTSITFKNPTPITYDSTWFVYCSELSKIYVPHDKVMEYKMKWTDVAKKITFIVEATNTYSSEWKTVYSSAKDCTAMVGGASDVPCRIFLAEETNVNTGKTRYLIDATINYAYTLQATAIKWALSTVAYKWSIQTSLYEIINAANIYNPNYNTPVYGNTYEDYTEKMPYMEILEYSWKWTSTTDNTSGSMLNGNGMVGAAPVIYNTGSSYHHEILGTAIELDTNNSGSITIDGLHMKVYLYE